MVYKYPISDTEKEQLAQSMGFGSWNEYITLDTERVPEPRPVLNSVDYSKVPDLTLSEEERDRLSNIRNNRGGRKGSRKGGRARALAQGQYVWSLEEIADIGELKYGEGLTWNDTASKMNEKYDKDYTTDTVRMAYQRNKHRLTDEEE